MGRIKQGIDGAFSGKVGAHIGGSWKGIATIRIMPSSVANPRTTPQVNQRTKFSAISIIASAGLGGFVKPLWDRWAGQMSGYNRFCQVNKANVDTNGLVDVANLTYSIGKMAPVTDIDCVADVSLGTIAGNVDMPLDPTYQQNSSSIYVSAFNRETGIYLGTDVVVGNPGSTLAYSITSDKFSVGDEIVFNAAVKRADGTQVSGGAGGIVVAVA